MDCKRFVNFILTMQSSKSASGRPIKNFCGLTNNEILFRLSILCDEDVSFTTSVLTKAVLAVAFLDGMISLEKGRQTGQTKPYQKFLRSALVRPAFPRMTYAAAGMEYTLEARNRRRLADARSQLRYATVVL
ncbi:hypothetical protein MRX96_007082 [Rhipicephalus microplus]